MHAGIKAVSPNAIHNSSYFIMKKDSVNNLKSEFESKFHLIKLIILVGSQIENLNLTRITNHEQQIIFQLIAGGQSDRAALIA
jgi:hypothetical protein